MFLATTALADFWDREQEILFLGSWCLREDRRQDWEGLRYHVLDSVWDDRTRFYEAAQYLEGVTERLQVKLGAYLNRAHNVSHGPRYWQILIGPWVMHFAHILYDRHTQLRDAIDKYPELDTIVMATASFSTPTDGTRLMEAVVDDEYNLQLVSQVLRETGRVFRAKPLSPPAVGQGRRHPRLRSALKHIRDASWTTLMSALYRLASKRDVVALSDVHAGRRHVWSVALKSRLRVLPLEMSKRWPFPPALPASDERRRALAGLSGGDSFEDLVIALLPENFPTLYLESYENARHYILEWADGFPAVLMSSTDWHFHEPFKFFAAEASECGTRLVARQHGGGYGVYKHSSVELHELRIADTFRVWGWAGDCPAQRCQNLPDPKLSSIVALRSQGRRATKSSILFVTTDHPPYLYRFQSSPVGSQFTAYFEWQRQFLAALPDEVRRSVIVRGYPHDFHPGMRQRMHATFPDVAWDKRASMPERLKSCRILVTDHLATTVLEALVANIPTVLFWDDRRWEVRPEARPYFDALRSCGVLWDGPREAAVAVARHAGDSDTWWQTPPVQDARRRFIDRFALADPQKCKTRWVDALLGELALSKNLQLRADAASIF